MTCHRIILKVPETYESFILKLGITQSLVLNLGIHASILIHVEFARGFQPESNCHGVPQRIVGKQIDNREGRGVRPVLRPKEIRIIQTADI